MKKIVLLSLLLTTLINSGLFSQSKAEIKNNFYDAESWILFEDYKEALPIYQQLLKVYPSNSNYKYRIGQCYINTPGEKARAMNYLEDAVKNINPKYREGRFKETGAPYDALYYLANAYRINNLLDKALDTYNLFRKNLDTKVYDTTIVILQIQSCINAKELINNPLYVRETNLGNNINDSKSEYNPVISDKEDLIVFSRSEAFYDAILYSKKTEGKWSGPINMNELLKVDKDFFPTSLSKDGKDLYLYSSVDYDGDIFTTRFENDLWSPLIKLNENINTKFWESHATISHDNKKLYFTSNRKGTIGGLDIYFSQRDSASNWGPAINLGPVINTPYNEESPFLSKDDKTLFFSSRGHFNMGGYDIFYSSLRENGEWSAPVNVGYPLNSTDDDVFFKPLNEGYEGYFAKDNPDGYGKQDIYRVEMFSENHPRKFLIRGIVTVADLNSNIRDSVKISAMNIKDPNQVLIVYSNPKTGEYEFELPQGKYKITYEGERGEKTVKNLDLALTASTDSLLLPGTVLPKTDFYAEMVVESNQTISVVNGDTIMFHLKVEPISVLTIEHWLGDSLLFVTQHQISDSTFTYKVAPKQGNNKIVFKLTDKFNNSISADIFIIREKEIKEQLLIRPEYSRVISEKQIAAFTAMLKSRVDDKLLTVISGAHIKNQKFGKIDDLISYLKEEAGKKNINPEEFDKLALKVAVMDNVLTQAAVDLMAKYTDGDLKDILSNLDIYKENLKTWTDLQEYVSAKTGGKTSPDKLNKIAEAILAGIDPSIAIIREKILTFSENSKFGTILRQSVATIDPGNAKTKGKWLQSVYTESIKQGLTIDQMSELLAIISSLPDTKVEQYLSDLIEYSEEPLISSLKSLNLKKEKIKSSKDLVLFLLQNKNKEKYPEEAVFKSIANLIAAIDIPSDTITSQVTTTKKNGSCILWILLGVGLFLFIFILWRRKKKKEKKDK